jgi:hypothetical protein
MRLRLLFFAAAYSLFLLLLFLFPPYRDGLHHLYNWVPAPADEVLFWSPDGPRDFGPAIDLFRPDLRILGVEALIGLLATVFAALALEFVMQIDDIAGDPFYEVAGSPFYTQLWYPRRLLGLVRRRLVRKREHLAPGSHGN